MDNAEDRKQELETIGNFKTKKFRRRKQTTLKKTKKKQKKPTT